MSLFHRIHKILALLVRTTCGSANFVPFQAETFRYFQHPPLYLLGQALNRGLDSSLHEVRTTKFVRLIQFPLINIKINFVCIKIHLDLHL